MTPDQRAAFIAETGYDPDDVWKEMRGWATGSGYKAEPVTPVHQVPRGPEYASALSAWRKTETPVCWSWPVPASREYADEQTAMWALQAWQAGRCAVCGGLLAGMGQRLVDDHDHETGLIRGLLCNPCNVSEGRGNSLTIQRYRERNPASILGIRVRYFNAWTRECAEPAEQVDRAARKAAVARLHIPRPEDLTGARQTGHA